MTRTHANIRGSSLRQATKRFRTIVVILFQILKKFTRLLCRLISSKIGFAAAAAADDDDDDVHSHSLCLYWLGYLFRWRSQSPRPMGMVMMIISIFIAHDSVECSVYWRRQSQMIIGMMIMMIYIHFHSAWFRWMFSALKPDDDIDDDDDDDNINFHSVWFHWFESSVRLWRLVCRTDFGVDVPVQCQLQ